MCKVTNVSIKPISQNLIEYSNTSANNEWQKDNFWKKSEFTQFKYFKWSFGRKLRRYISATHIESLVDGWWWFKIINNCFKRFATTCIILWFTFWKIVFLTFLFGHPRSSFTCSYQKLTQDELTSVNRKFTYYINNIYKNYKKFNTFHIVFHILSNPSS